MIQKPLPHNIEAEAGVIGTILNNNKVIDTAIEIISSQDFYNAKCRTIFETIEKLHEKESAIDVLTVAEGLNHKLTEIGGITYLTELMANYGITSNAKEYAVIVKEKSNLRKIISAANEMLMKAYDEKETETILNETQNNIMHINNYHETDISSSQEVAVKAFEAIERNYNNGGGLTGLSTGLRDIDEMLGGMNEADYIILAARPSMGKTAFMMTLSQNVAKTGKSVLVFSLEMTEQKLMNRMFASMTGLPLQRVSRGELTSDEWLKLGQATEGISNEKLFFDDHGGQTVNEIRNKARKVKLQHGLDLIVIDYIGKIKPVGRSESRTQEVSAISGALKDIAKEMSCPVIVLSQLSRACEARPNKRPMLSDLRESGSLEQDADVVMMLYRDEYYDADTDDKNVLEAIITKSRDGRTGTQKLYWNGDTQTIACIDYTYSGQYRPDVF